MDRSEIGVSVIFILLISVVSITLLIALMARQLPSFGKELYCSTLFHIFGTSLAPESVRADQSYCQKQAYLDVHRITPRQTYIDSFADNRPSKQISDDVVYIELTAKNVTSAFMNISNFEDSEKDVIVDVGENSIDFGFVLQPHSSRSLNFTDQLNQYLSGSQTQRVPIRIGGQNIVLHDLLVNYTRYFVEEEILAAIINCWQLSEFGKSNQDIYCSEIVVPEIQPNISENNITRLLVKENLCHVFSNNDSINDCGDSNQLDWKVDINNVSNILVEYNSQKRRIVVT